MQAQPVALKVLNVASGVLVLAAAGMVFLYAPLEETMDYVQKIFYFHVANAWVGMLGFMLVVEAIVLPVYSLLYGVNLFNPGLIGVILLGSVGYVAVGTLLASMAVQARTRDILLPILLFPVAVPVLVAAVKASGGFLQGGEAGTILPWINLLIVYDVVFIAAAFMLFDFVVEE